jgi:hypothetical protein
MHVTETVTQANVAIVASAPAQAMAMVYQTAAYALGLSMLQASQAQQHMQTIATTVTTQCTNLILGLHTPHRA